MCGCLAVSFGNPPKMAFVSMPLKVKFSTDGSTELCLSRGSRPVARFYLRAALRPHASATVKALRSAGIDTHIVSGDAEPATHAIASDLGEARAMTGTSAAVQFLSAARPGEGPLRATAQPLRIGRRVAVCEATVEQGERLVCKGTFTFLLTERP